MIHFCSGICHFQPVYDGAEWREEQKRKQKLSAKINNNEAQHITNATAVYVRLVGNTVKRNFVFKIYSFIIDDLFGRESAPKSHNHHMSLVLVARWLLVFATEYRYVQMIKRGNG